MGDETDLGEMKDLTSTSFGYIIGFLLPGLLGLYALSFWSRAVQKLIEPALKADATVGPSVILVLVALGVGLCISALRFFVFEKVLCRKHSFPKDMFARLTSGDKLPAFKAVVDEHYRYHQFYGGIAVSLAVQFGGWVWYSFPGLTCRFLVTISSFIFFEVILGFTASDAFRRYVERGTFIVNGTKTESKLSHH